MGIDVASYLSILLYRHNAVVVPSFGGFIATPVGATIDHASGMLHPPSKIVAFNEHLVINDGYLINYIRQRHGITVQESRVVIENFVKSLNDILQSNETVILPEIGKLSLSRASGKILFIADNTNYNTAAFGLPPLHYYPTAKASAATTVSEIKAARTPMIPIPEVVVPQLPTAAVPVTTASTSSTANHAVSDTTLDVQEALPMRQVWYQRIGLRREAIPALILASAITFAVAMYMYGSKQRIAAEAQPVSVSEETRVNVRPQPTDIKVENETAVTTEKIVAVEPDKTTASADIPEIVKAPKARKEETTNDKTTSTTGRKCTVVIGSFADQNNVSKLSKRVRTKGFTAFRRNKNGTTLVGATFVYDGEQERASRLKQIRKWFGKSAYVLKK